MSEVPEVWTIASMTWIADKMDVGTNWTVVQKQTSKRKGITQITMMRHNCGRPRKEEGK